MSPRLWARIRSQQLAMLSLAPGVTSVQVSLSLLRARESSDYHLPYLCPPKTVPRGTEFFFTCRV